MNDGRLSNWRCLVPHCELISGRRSDIDLLVEFDERARHTLFDMGRMERELESLFGREVDLIERASIEQGDNLFTPKVNFPVS